MKIRVSLLSFVFAFSALVPAAAENIRLTVFHTNDIHGWFMARPDKKRKDRRVGGAAVLANVIKRHREKDGGPYLLLDAGDWFQGTPEGTLTEGASMAELYNALGYDALTVGNHEYDIGNGALKRLTAKIKVPILAANVFKAGTDDLVDYVRPFLIKEIAGVKVGLFGFNTSNMRHLSFAKNIEGLEFRDEVETARKMVKRLKAEGADVIIALSHAGYEQPKHKEFVGDQTIAREVPGIDLIVGGHSHTPVWKPRKYGDALVVQAWAYLTHVGKVELEIDPETKKVVASTGRLVKLWVDKWGEDADTLKIIKRYQNEVGRRLDVVIGRAEETLTRRRRVESRLGDWMTDCMRKWSKTDIAVQNGGGIRSNLNKGPVTLRHIFEIMPFDNYLVTMNMKGKSVRGLFERGASGAVGMIQLSGASFAYDPSAEVGKRLRRVLVGGKPLDPEAVYSVAAPDFIVQGGDGYADFAQGTDKAATSTLVRDALVWCVRGYSPVRPGAPDRITEK